MNKQKRIMLEPSAMGDESMTAMYLNPAYAASGDVVSQAQYDSVERVAGSHNLHDYVFMRAPNNSESETDASGAPPPLQPRSSRMPMTLPGAASTRPTSSGLSALPPPLPPSNGTELPRKMNSLRRFSVASTFAHVFGRHTSVSSSTTLGKSLGHNDMIDHTSVNINNHQTGRPPRGESAHKRVAPRPGGGGVSRMQIAFFVLAAAAFALALTALGLAARKSASSNTSPQGSPQGSTSLDDAAASESTKETYMLQLQSLWEGDANAVDYAAVYSVARPKIKLNFDTLQAPAASLSFPTPIGIRLYKRGMPTTTQTIHWISDHYVLLMTGSSFAIWDADAVQQTSSYTISPSPAYSGGTALAGDKSCFAHTYVSQRRTYSYWGGFSTSSTFHLQLYRISFSLSSSIPSINSLFISYSSTSMVFSGATNAVALSGDGGLLVIGTTNGYLCEWRKNAEAWPSQPSCRAMGSYNFASVSISVDSQYYLVGNQMSSSSFNSRLLLFPAGGGPANWTVSSSDILYPSVYSVALAANSTVALACDGYNIYARSVETGRFLWTQGHDCEALQIMPNNDRYVLVYEDGAPLYILAVSDGSMVATIGVAGEPITITTASHAFNGVAMSPDGIIYVAGNPCQVYVPLLGQTWF
jgi:hypothetical protein